LMYGYLQGALVLGAGVQQDDGLVWNWKGVAFLPLKAMSELGWEVEKPFEVRAGVYPRLEGLIGCYSLRDCWGQRLCAGHCHLWLTVWCEVSFRDPVTRRKPSKIRA
jgi:hypothetical protein